MFVAGVPLLERVIRATLVYGFAVVALRLAGKRELGQLSTFDLVVLLFFSNVLQNSINGPDNSVTGGVVGAATMLGLHYLVARLTFANVRVAELIDGRPTTLIEDGQILPDNLARELISRAELTVACHRQGVRRLEDVDLAMLEPGGAITVFARQPSAEKLADDEILRELRAIRRTLAQITVSSHAPGTSEPA